MGRTFGSFDTQIGIGITSCLRQRERQTGLSSLFCRRQKCWVFPERSVMVQACTGQLFWLPPRPKLQPSFHTLNCRSTALLFRKVDADVGFRKVFSVLRKYRAVKYCPPHDLYLVWSARKTQATGRQSLIICYRQSTAKR